MYLAMIWVNVPQRPMWQSYGHQPLVLLGGGRTYKRWGFVEEPKSLWVCLWGVILVFQPLFLHPVCFSATTRWAAFFVIPSQHGALRCSRLKSRGPNNRGPNSPEPWGSRSLFSWSWLYCACCGHGKLAKTHTMFSLVISASPDIYFFHTFFFCCCFLKIAK